MISSRTPEGLPGRCPVCGRPVRVEPSSYPTPDACCPCCGTLLRATKAGVGLAPAGRRLAKGLAVLASAGAACAVWLVGASLGLRVGQRLVLAAIGLLLFGRDLRRASTWLAGWLWRTIRTLSDREGWA